MPKKLGSDEEEEEEEIPEQSVGQFRQEIEEAVTRLKNLKAQAAREHREETEQEKILLLLLIILVDVDERLRKQSRKLIRIWRLLKKIVTSVAVVTVATDAASYEHAKPVTITGDVSKDGVPQPNEPVNLKITDITGAEFKLPDATTGADGKFAAAWTILPEVAPGVCTLEATALGMTVASTFTFTEDVPPPLK